MVIDYLWHIYQSTLIKYYQTMFSSEKLKNMIFITLVFCIWTCSCMLHFSILSLCKYQCSISPIKNICSYQFLDDSASSAKSPCTSQTVSETAKQNTNQNSKRHAQETNFCWYSELGSNNRYETWAEKWVGILGIGYSFQNGTTRS